MATERNTYERTHPVMIFQNLWRVFYLIIIPVLRGFVLALQKDLLAWLTGAWADIIVLLLMTAIAVLQWRFLRYSCDSGAIRVRSGIFFRTETVILWDRVATASVVEAFYLRPFGAVAFRVETLGGNRRHTDLSLFLSIDRARQMMDMRGEDTDSSLKKQYLPRNASILSLSILTSSSLGGIVFIATFVSQAGKLLGKEFSNMIIYTFEDLARSLAFGIPPAAAAIAYALLGGWLIGFLITFIGYRNFEVSRRDTILSVKSGAPTTRTYSIGYDKISYIDIRQNIVAKMLKLYSLYIYAVGYGKHKGDISCVVPAVKLNDFTAARQMLFPGFAFTEPSIKSPGNGIMRFISQPLAPMALIPAAMASLIYFFPSWNNFILFTGIMFLVPCALMTIVRVIAFRTGGISKGDGCYTLRFSKGFSIHTVIVPADKIALVNLRQNLFQSRGKCPTCDLIIYTVAEGERAHLCRNVRFQPASGLFTTE